jgi:polysaccharide biosynthesis protein PslG
LTSRGYSRPFAAILLAVLLVVAAGGCGGSTSVQVPPPSPGVEFGFNEDRSVPAYGLQAELGMPVRRMSVDWGAVEPRLGHWDWASYDSDYRAMRSSGLLPLLVAVGAPCWATDAESECERGVRQPPDQGHDLDWGEFVRRLADRYPSARAIEVWNEPNIVPYFRPYPDAVRFTALLKTAYEAVKSVDAKMPVVSGGLFPSPETGSFGIGDGQFLASMYAAGAAGFMDGIGAHPYPFGPPGEGYDIGATRADIERLREVRDAAGDSSTPIWITEMGVSTASAPGYPPGETEAGQKEDLLALVATVLEDRKIPVAIIHRLVDAPYDASGDAIALVDSGFGVFRTDGTPKQAACALSREFRGSLDC